MIHVSDQPKFMIALFGFRASKHRSPQTAVGNFVGRYNPMRKPMVFYSRAAILGIVLLAAGLLLAGTPGVEAGYDYNGHDQTNSNSKRKKKPKKVVKAIMNKPRRTSVSPGNWGGNGIRLVVETASAAIEYDCAHGEITEILMIDKGGNFDAKGVHIRERGGPIREGDHDKREPARYTGRISGNQMALKVTLVEKDTPIGDFQLELGKNVRLHKCL